VPSSTCKKENDETMLLSGIVLGFPPVRYGEWGRGTPDALKEETVTLNLVNHVGAKMIGISLDPQKTTSLDNP
jgi:hypothetical protein